jgi:hypothetical protein
MQIMQQSSDAFYPSCVQLEFNLTSRFEKVRDRNALDYDVGLAAQIDPLLP